MNEDLLRSITKGVFEAFASINATNNVSAGNAANNVKREDKNMSGRSITLGTWNGKPIEWLVLKEEGLATLVISKDTIGNYYFDGNSSNSSWAHSWLRTFLNNDFYEKTFTAEEKKKIVNAKLTDVGNAKDNVFYYQKMRLEPFYQKKMMIMNESLIGSVVIAVGRELQVVTMLEEDILIVGVAIVRAIIIKFVLRCG